MLRRCEAQVQGESQHQVTDQTTGNQRPRKEATGATRNLIQKPKGRGALGSACSLGLGMQNNVSCNHRPGKKHYSLPIHSGPFVSLILLFRTFQLSFPWGYLELQTDKQPQRTLKVAFIGETDR